ncbi:hypothetical protein [Novosphingobium sp. YAF33]|uniref:hypothetical protein n=1 Tax=Novosphingobium sp. YAF33 TaxID=3233082 RepID=UPI003F9CA4DC
MDSFFAALKINDKPQAYTTGSGKVILAKTLCFTLSADQMADLRNTLQRFTPFSRTGNMLPYRAASEYFPIGKFSSMEARK